MVWGEPIEQTGYTKWDKPGKVIVGKYVRSEEREGKDKKTNFVHWLDAEGEEVQFWGTRILNDLLEQVAPGTLVRIEYVGERAVPNGKIKDFRVQPWVEDQGKGNPAIARIENKMDEALKMLRQLTGDK